MSFKQPRTARELRQLVEHRLRDTHPSTDPAQAHLAGLRREMDPLIEKFMPKTLVAAAVLMPLVDRGTELTVLFTQRASTLRKHPGQVSFPGGRIESADKNPWCAALRETHEEIGLDREFISLAGYLDPQLLSTGFWVTPVVGFIRPGFTLRVDHNEVDDTFEVPLEFILNPANHLLRELDLGDRKVSTHEFRHEDRVIWGATASMLMTFYRLIEMGTH